jgi:hypothetical protein
MKRLLLAGPLSSILYVSTIDILAPLFYPEYHGYTSQMVSELMAVGAPTRNLLVAMFLPYNALVFAFAIGVWIASKGRTWARLTAIALFGYAITSTLGLLVAPMDLRGTVDSTRDSLHIVMTIVMSFFIVLSMAFGAASGSGGFRRYTLITIAVVMIFGALAAYLARPMPGPTPGLGIAERVNIYATMLWFSVVGSTVMPNGLGGGR